MDKFDKAFSGEGLVSEGEITQFGGGELVKMSHDMASGLPPIDRERQLKRIGHLRDSYPAVTDKREHIRSFVTRCATMFNLENPVLDVGCGYRSNEPEICSSRLMDFYTLDINPEHSPDFLSDAMDMQCIPPEIFGSAVCTELLEHIEYPAMALSEIFRILKPNGLLILTVPFWVPIHEKDWQPDYWRFTPRAVRFLLCRFTIELLEIRGHSDSPTGIFVLARKPPV